MDPESATEWRRLRLLRADGLQMTNQELDVYLKVNSGVKGIAVERASSRELQGLNLLTSLL
jgi:hypothetical protein